MWKFIEIDQIYIECLSKWVLRIEFWIYWFLKWNSLYLNIFILEISMMTNWFREEYEIKENKIN